MNRTAHLPRVLMALTLIAGGATFAVGQSPKMPQGHPPVGMPDSPPLPAGHPDTTNPPEPVDALADAPEADLKDVASIDNILSAYYQTISGPRGQPRDWDRLRTLMIPKATFSTTRAVGKGASILTISLDGFIKMNSVYFERGGYFESQVNQRVETFGAVAQVFSTYESRRGSATVPPYLRGINGFQLLNDGSRWWIVSVVWDYERPDHNPIPPRYLPGSDQP